MLVPGTLIDRYEVEAEIGRGAMASVYRVRHTGLDTRFALKVMAIDHPAARERFRREAHVQASVRHANLVAVHDFLDVGGAPGLVMELVDGQSLASCLAARLLTEAEAEALFRDVLDGVEAAHTAGVVHRDLKPGNVLLAETRVGVVAKVGDFGIAKVLSEGANAWSLTASGTTMGTPGYLAPEQIRAAKHVDHRADLFSLGCVYYRMVCGRSAFTGDIREVFNAITSGGYPPLASIVPDLSPRMARAIDACLVTDRERRVQSCAALRAILDDGAPEGLIRPAGFSPRASVEGDGLARHPISETGTPSADTFTLEPSPVSPPATARSAVVAVVPAAPDPVLAARRPSRVALLAVAAIVAALAVGGFAFWAGMR